MRIFALNENKRRKHRKASAAKKLAFSLPSRRCFYNLKISGHSGPFGPKHVDKKNNIKGGVASSAARQFRVHFVYLPRAGNPDSFLYPPTGARSEELH